MKKKGLFIFFLFAMKGWKYGVTGRRLEAVTILI